MQSALGAQPIVRRSLRLRWLAARLGSKLRGRRELTRLEGAFGALDVSRWAGILR